MRQNAKTVATKVALVMGLLVVETIGGTGTKTVWAQSHAKFPPRVAVRMQDQHIGEVPYQPYSPQAEHFVQGHPIAAHRSQHHCQSCQSCQTPVASSQEACLYCELKTKRVETEKFGYRVEQKEVCVPAVRFPWMKCNPPKRSRVRTVNVLTKQNVKHERHQYDWSVHEPGQDEDAIAVNGPTPLPREGGSSRKSNNGGAGANGLGLEEDYPDPYAGPSNAKLSDPGAAFGDVPKPPTE